MPVAGLAQDDMYLAALDVLAKWRSRRGWDSDYESRVVSVPIAMMWGLYFFYLSSSYLHSFITSSIRTLRPRSLNYL